MKVLLVTMYFPPAGGGGVQRPLKFATHLPALGIETHVLAPDDPKWVHVDAELQPPTQAWIHRARYLGPRSRRLADDLHGRQGLDRLSRQARSLSTRLLVPDENVTWNLTAISDVTGTIEERYGFTPYGLRTVLTATFTFRSTSSDRLPIQYVFPTLRAFTNGPWPRRAAVSLVAPGSGF